MRKILCWHWEHTRHGRFGTYLEMLLQQASLLTPPAVHTGRDAHAEDEDDDDTASLESFVSNTSAGTITPATDFFYESQRQGFRVGDRSHEAVSRRPPISLYTIIARAHMYTYAAKVWDLFVVQGPFSAPLPNPDVNVRFALFTSLQLLYTLSLCPHSGALLVFGYRSWCWCCMTSTAETTLIGMIFMPPSPCEGG